MTDHGHEAEARTARDRALALLRETETCTLATVTPDGAPEAATVRFVARDGYDIAVNTSRTYRKYENMRTTPRVAVVVDGEAGNLQLEGVARELQGAAAEAVRDQYVAKYGPSEYVTAQDSVRFEIETDWARLLRDGSHPPDYEMLVGDGETDLH